MYVSVCCAIIVAAVQLLYIQHMMCIYTYICVYIERERERDTDARAESPVPCAAQRNHGVRRDCASLANLGVPKADTM